MTRQALLRGVAVVLAAEKSVQHVASALLFLGLFPAIGVPDAGDRIALGPQTLFILNAVYAAAFAAALGAFLTRHPWARASLIALALLDIVLEFVFHRVGFITVSVIVSLLLSLLVVAEMWTGRNAR